MNDDGIESIAPYPYYFDPTFHRYRLGEPQKKKKPQTVFVGSMCDLFGEWVPDEWIAEVFKACAAAPWHRYLFLTKNPARYADLRAKDMLPPEHWYGITRDGKNAPGRSIWKAGCKFFASYEPLLEDIGDCGRYPWIIIGAETGARKGKAAPRREWVERLADCVSARNNYTKVFMKDSLIPVMGEENMLREFPWEGKYGPRAAPWNKRRTQESNECEFCANFDFGSATAQTEKAGETTRAGISFAGGSSRFPAEKQFKFCPVCGRRANQSEE
jgi:hypothetical protein